MQENPKLDALAELASRLFEAEGPSDRSLCNSPPLKRRRITPGEMMQSAEKLHPLAGQLKSSPANRGENEGNEAYCEGEIVVHQTIIYPKGSEWRSYTGTLKDGQPHGKGKLFFSDNSVFRGNFLDGQFHGKGSLTRGRTTVRGVWENGELDSEGHEATTVHSDRRRVTGFIIGGIRSQGTIDYTKGSEYKSYKGSLKDDVPHGEGNMIFSDGATFQGMFEKGGPCGYGTFSDTNGIIKEGMWKNGALYGKASVRYADGGLLEGVFEEGILLEGKMWHKGRRLYTFKSYEGALKDLRPHGEGKMILTNGSIYVGFFENGWWHGRGKLSTEKKGIIEGNWQNGELRGNITVFYPNGRCVQGNFEQGISKEGTITYEEDSIYERYQGSLRYSKPDGQGEMVFSDGTVFKGFFKEGKLQWS